MLGPKLSRQLNCERTDVYCLWPFFFVCLVERRIEQPLIFDDHRKMPQPHPWACSSSAAWFAPAAENCPANLPVVREDCCLYAQRARVISQPPQHSVQRK